MKLLSFLLAALFISAANANLIEKDTNFDSDVPDDVKKQYIADLNVVLEMKGAKQTPLHQDIFGKLEGQTYHQFLTDRVKSVGIDDCGGGSGVMACVQPFFDSSKMWLTPNLLQAGVPQASRILIYFHEARHTEDDKGNWPHAFCPVPFLDENGQDIVGLTSGTKLEGQPACDTRLLGAYGVGIFMMKNISLFCDTCSDKFKMDSDLYSTDQVKRFHKPETKKKALADFDALAVEE